ncbi:MAG: hypothetical protein LW859_25535 [Anabaena sp. 49633_E8]|nr:hypothetical protein [Anabaena sp. 49633_E8]
MYPWLVISCQLSVGAKHLEDKLSVIAKNSSPRTVVIWKINYRSLPKIVLQMLRPYSCYLLVVNYLSHFREQRLKLVWY